jgi:hypothetical protein
MLIHGDIRGHDKVRADLDEGQPPREEAKTARRSLRQSCELGGDRPSSGDRAPHEHQGCACRSEAA